MRLQDRTKKERETLEERAKRQSYNLVVQNVLYFGLEKSILQVQDGNDQIHLQCM